MSKQWQVSHTETTIASPEAIWAHWTNVSGWPEEDSNLETAKLEGEFAVGSKIVMKPKGSPKSQVTITEIIPGKAYSTTGKIPLGKLLFSHEVKQVEAGKTEFTHTITMTGPLRGLFVKLFGQNLADNLPEKMRNIAKLAEQQ